MSNLKNILSSMSDNSWDEIYNYAQELNKKCNYFFKNFSEPDNETISDIKELLHYADSINDNQKLQILQAMIDCTDYFDIKSLRFLLSSSKTMDSWDYDLIRSRIRILILEEREHEEQRISKISYNRNQIIQYIYNHYYNLPVPKDWYNNHWDQLCDYLNSAFDMTMDSYKNGNVYSITTYDAAIIIAYGIMINNESHKYKSFLEKIEKKDYSSVTVTEWNTFWKLIFNNLKNLLSEYIKDDIKRYGTCPNSKLLCKDCEEFYYCPHCSSIGKTINTTELAVQDLLKIRDNILKSASASKEMIKKFADFLKDRSLDIDNNKRQIIISIYLSRLYRYLFQIMQRIKDVRNDNENYAFLESGDFDIDCEKQIIRIPFEMPEIRSIFCVPYTNDTKLLTQKLTDRIDNYFTDMQCECYQCMMICPSKSTLANLHEQTNMLSQQANLFKLSLKNAIDILKRKFKTKNHGLINFK